MRLINSSRIFAVLFALLSVSLYPQIDTMMNFSQELYQKYGEDYRVFQITYNRALYYVEKDPERARSILHSIESLVTRNITRETLFISSYYFVMGQIERQEGNPLAALIDYQQALNYQAQDKSNGENIPNAANAWIMVDIANIYYSLNLFDGALNYYHLALKYFPKDDMNGTSVCMNNLGLIQENKGNLDSAYAYFKKGYDIRIQMRDADSTFLFGHSLKYISRVLLKKHNYDSAKIVLQNAIWYLEKNKRYWAKMTLMEAYNLFAQIYIELNQPQTGVDYYSRSEKIGLETGSTLGLCDLYNEMASYYMKINNVSLARVYAFKSYQLAETKNLSDKKLDALSLLCKLYLMMGDKVNSAAYFKEYQMLDSIKEITITKAGLKTFQEVLSVSERMNAQEKELSQEQNRNRIIVLTSVLAILFIAACSFILYFRYVIQKRTKKELIRIQEELKNEVEVKNKFFSIMAHDLKAPFTGLLGYTSILAEEFDTMEQTELKKMIFSLREITENTYRLLDNLLEWARLERNQISCQPEAIMIAKQLSSTISLTMEGAKNKNIQLTEDIEPSHSVIADRHMFDTIFRNLLSNALKFSYPGTEIGISSKENGPYIDITVYDKGMGMGEDIIEKIFSGEIPKSTPGTQNETGTGLGLLICKEFVERNNGRISVESKAGNGTRFTVSLPKVI